MGFSLRKLLNEATAQVNPFDHGQTAATVRAQNTRPAPASTPPPNVSIQRMPAQPPLSVQPSAPTPSLTLAHPAPLPHINLAPPAPQPNVTVMNNGPARTTPDYANMPVDPESHGLPALRRNVLHMGHSLVDPVRNTLAIPVEAGRSVVADVTGNDAAMQAAEARKTADVNDSLPVNIAKGAWEFADAARRSPAAFRNVVTGGPVSTNPVINAILNPAQAIYQAAGGKPMALSPGDQTQINEGLTSLNKSYLGPVLTAPEKVITSNIPTAADAAAAAGFDPNQSILSTVAKTAVGIPQALAPAGGLEYSAAARGLATGAAESVPKLIQAARDANAAGGEGGFIRLPGRANAGDMRTPAEITAAGGARPANELQTQLETAWNGNDLPGAQKVIDQLPPELKQPMQALQDTKMAEVRTATGTPEAVSPPSKSPAPSAPAAPPASKSSPFTAPEINKTKYNVPEQAQKELDTLAQDLRPDIEKTVGRKLSLQEIKQTADATGKVLTNAKTREATLNYSASLLNAREELASLIQKRTAGSITPEEAVRLHKVYATVKNAAADAGRTLNAFKEVASPAERTIIDVMIDRITKTGAKLDDIQGALGRLGPNPTPKDLTAFYREFVKATKGDWLDKFRYTNMLSSPLTHIVNAASNASGVFGIAPVQKLVEGTLDAARSAVTGGPRTRYASEAGSFIKGSAKSIPEAGKNFWNVLTDKSIMGNPDFDALRNIPLATKGAAGVADKTLTFVPKLLEASDQFFTTLAKGGERAGLATRASKGVKVDLSDVAVAKVADDAAAYRLFRQQLGKEGQGHILDAVDTIPKAVQQWRNSPNPVVRNAAKFTFPFISTPTNIFKQGLEYTPTGFITMIGAADKTAQAAKATMGTAVIASAAGLLAANDAITFAEPADAKQRAAFRAEGKQPYSIKLGDKWYSYSKTHPAIAFNLAIVGATKDALDKGSIDQSTADKVMSAASGVLGFFRDQSYMKSVGDFTSILQSKDGASLGDVAANQTANTANQLVPFKSLTSWAGRWIDPTQRKIDYSSSTTDQIFQSMVKDIPGLNKNVPTRDNPFTGEPLTNPHPALNSFNPIRVSNDQGFGNTTGLSVDQREQQRDLPANQREPFRRGIVEDKFAAKQATDEMNAIKAGKEPKTSAKPSANNNGGKEPSTATIRQLSSGKYYAKVGDQYKTFDNKDKAQKAVDKYNEGVQLDKFKNSGSKTTTINGKYYYKAGDGSVKSKSQAEYTFDKQDSANKLAMDRAQANDDVKGWVNAAGDRLTALDKKKQQFDPETESDQIDRITLEQENLQSQIDKYQGYGGFTKPKKVGAGSRSSYKLYGFKSNPVTTGKSLRSILAAAKVTKGARA